MEQEQITDLTALGKVKVYRYDCRLDLARARAQNAYTQNAPFPKLVRGDEEMPLSNV